MTLTIFVSIFVSCMIVSIVGVALAIHAVPFYSPREFVPIFGMVVGNTMTSIAVAINSLMNSLVNGKERIELYLAFGSTSWEAARPIILESLRLGLLPGINQMAITGLISIPGMMTGQILAGSDVDNAVRYQQIIMFMITSSSALGAIMAVLSCIFIIFDRHSRLRTDFIYKKSG